MLLLAGIAFAGLGGLAGAAFGIERHRRGRFLAASADRGWTYARRDRALQHRWQTWPFGIGRLRRARHVLSGSVDGRSFLAFEYTFRQPVPGGPGGLAEAVSTWSVAAVALPARMPRIAVSRTGPSGRMAAVLGRQGVEFESEEFNRRFRVRSDDPRTASDVLHPGLLAALVDGPFFDFRMESADALSCWPGRMKLGDVDQRLRFLSSVVDEVPDHVWRDRSR
ncbi:MAG TPA: hypothetical protein VLR26_10295 [Frankiaceae bacterium]|nr:hypothetical protein [Frankiaceae bacterium]